MKPYIGITGFTSVDEIRSISSAAVKLGLGNDKDYTLMMGFLVSDSRIKNPLKRSTRSPAYVDLVNLLSHVPEDMLPVIHYDTSNKNDLSEQIIGLFDVLYEHNYSRTVQLNISWPDIGEIRKVKNTFPDLDVVVCLTNKMLRTPEDELVSRMGAYEGWVSYVLIDPSGGYGLDFDEIQTTFLLSKLDKVMPTSIKGFAGGLDYTNVFDKVKRISSNYGLPFFIDAEGKLRTEDHLSLDVGNCVNYISNALLALKEN